MRNTISIGLLFLVFQIVAQPGTVSEHLKVDQFGYPPDVQKICVVNNPTAGFDFEAGDFYTPGATLQVVKAADNSIIMSGPAVAWHGGASYDQSGDIVWWFDFSAVTTPGTYFIYDPLNVKRSFTFDIRADVYTEVLKKSVRMFYYQRSGFAKTAPFAYDWADGASHLGTQQDLDCRLVTNPVPGTSKQLQGGWFDAGDYNKYVNFAYEPIHDLSLAYIERPEVWTDDYNIPESGNGIPDLLDEMKWELDWLRRMQLANGSMLMKVSVTDFSAASPPSADSGARRYGPAQASATRTAASMFAIAAIAYNLSGHPAMQLYADTLEQAARKAWYWLIANPAYSYYNNAGFSSANPEMNEYQQSSAQVGAAVALFALTDSITYRNYVDDHYDEMHPIQWGFWYPWESIIQDLLLYYSVLPNGTTGVKNAIRSSFTNSMNNSGHLLPAINGTSCAYRGYMSNGDNVWGSNRPRGHTGSIFYNVIEYNISGNTSVYRNAAMGYINFLHGVNPISTVMLTNMYDDGAEKPANEMYHSWFAHGTNYDNAITSLYGPAPGYQPGGFNPYFHPDPSFSGDIVPPELQPSLKSYKDWNTSWPENSWEITETSISNQGSYVKLLSRFVSTPCVKTITNAYDSGFGTLRQAIACANAGDTIKLKLPPNTTLQLNSQLVINKNIVIVNSLSGQAPVHCAVSGAGIQINSGQTVHLYDLSFTGACTNIIQNQGNLHLHHVKFDATGVTSNVLKNLGGEARVYGVVELKE
ncbi:MAG: glycoside hydrolase family 9 protein [Saprospiraceae bacterium]|nr:glycoside hydrolase family 9 protein [Candidatus Opimibacter skivensis]